MNLCKDAIRLMWTICFCTDRYMDISRVDLETKHYWRKENRECSDAADNLVQA